MSSIFEFDNYRKFLLKKIMDMPNKGYGQMSKLATFLGVHTTLISQILKEHKSLSADQGVLISDYFGFNEMESEYFILLIQFDRAGNPSARSFYQRQIQNMKEKAQVIAKRVHVDGQLTDEQRAIFYSDWTYSAVRQSVAIANINTVDKISERLGLPKKRVQSILDFLVQTGLCKVVNNRIKIGPNSTHIESSSPWAKVHHANWRQQALKSFDSNRSENLHYTCPLTISRKDAELVREKIIQFIEQVNSIVDPSPSESLCCLNIDWFDVCK